MAVTTWLMVVVFSQYILYSKCFDAVKNKVCQKKSRNELDMSIINEVLTTNNLQTDSHICLFTSVTDNILNYAAYSLAINTIYALRRNYSFYVVNTDTETDLTTGMSISALVKDARWHKIYLLLRALRPGSTQFRHCEYLVWLDADLVLLDHTFQFERLMAQLQTDRARTMDLVMSKDMEKAPFVSNSGCIVARSSQWSLDFLALWFQSYDRDRCCDQNAFTWLYNRHTPADVHQHVALLPASALNTDFPAWRTQQPTDSFLHLAGLNALYRQAVFRRGLANLCDNTTTGLNQLGLSREVLLQELLGLDARRLAAMKLLLNEEVDSFGRVEGGAVYSNCMTTASPKSNSLLASTLCVRDVLDDLVKGDDDEHVQRAAVQQGESEDGTAEHTHVETMQMIANTRVWIFDRLSEVVADLEGSGAVDLASRLEVRRETVASGFEAVVLLLSQPVGADSAKSVVVLRMLNDIDSLLTVAATELAAPTECDHEHTKCDDGLATRFRQVFSYYSFKHAQLMANYWQWQQEAQASPHSDSSSGDQRILWLQAAARLFDTVVLDGTFFGSHYVLADPLKEIASVHSELGLLQCLRGRHQAGLSSFAAGIDMLRGTAEGLRSSLISTREVTQHGHLLLAETLVNAGICCYECVTGGTDLWSTECSLDRIVEHFSEALQLIGSHMQQLDETASLSATCLRYIDMIERRLADGLSARHQERPTTSVVGRRKLKKMKRLVVTPQ